MLHLPPVATPRRPVEDLVAALAGAVAGQTCNFYSDASDAGESAGAAGTRRERLRRYLTCRWDAPVVLVGEAAGWQGARLSGIAFTSEHQLLGRGKKEPSATVVHRVLGQLDAERDVLLWNAVPFHPHAPGRPRSNRRPTTAEIAACQPFLEAVCAGRHVIAAGRIAAAAVDHAMGDRTNTPYVRHPAHGGTAEFTAGLARLLSLAQPGDVPAVGWGPRRAPDVALLGLAATQAPQGPGLGAGRELP
jgi:uracil-DNA glycosylase